MNVAARALLAPALLSLSLLVPVVPASAETLNVAASTERVEITSNFSGTTLTVYGTIERDRVTVGRAEGYEIAVVLDGPRRPVVARRKERIAGLWVNRAARTYEAPAFYALATTAPIADMAEPDVLKVAQVGIDSLILPERVPGGVEVMAGTAEFRDGLLRLKRRAGLYTEYPEAVKRIGSSLFSVSLPIPAEVPVGTYAARVVLFGGGSRLAESAVEVTVAKSGFESEVADLASRWPVAYGLMSVMVALFTGWLGGVMFRRD